MPKPVIIAIVVVAVLLGLPLAAKVLRPAAPATTPDPGSREVHLDGTTPASNVATNGAPSVVSFDPPNGATGVASATKELRVTFSVPMGKGFSWTGGGPNFPGASGGPQPYWMPDQKTCILPVSLRPNCSYQCGLNSKSFKNFKSATGIPLTPVVYTFTTGN